MIGTKTAKSHPKSVIAFDRLPGAMPKAQVDYLLLKKRPIGPHPLVLAAR
jgi:hypothetical protein